MIEVRGTVRVRPSADEAFRYLVDFRNLPKWDPGIVEATKTDGATEVVAGSTFSVIARFFGRRVPMQYRVIELDEGARRAVLEGNARMVRAIDRIEVTPRDHGADVSWHAEFQLRGPRMGEWLMKPLMDRLGRKAMDGLRRALG